MIDIRGEGNLYSIVRLAMTNSAALAHSITWKSSKQSYLTARILADRDMVDDCLRAYAYLRWADDEIDIHLQSKTDRTAFIIRQKSLIDNLYRGERLTGLCSEEIMLADLIGHDRNPKTGLHSFLCNFISVIEFDSDRKGQLVSKRALAAYTICLATAVMDGIQYFIGHGHPYAQNQERIRAVTGAHITHMLRDMLEDIPNGMVNIPLEAFEELGMRIDNLDSEAFHLWVRSQVQIARQAFKEGQSYIDSIKVLRCKLAGVLYLARFECILDAIGGEGYKLRPAYPERCYPAAWWKMMRLGLRVIVGHSASQVRQTITGIHLRRVLSLKGSLRVGPSGK